MPGRTRCRFHGGLSTGAKTPEGKAKVERVRTAGVRASWIRWRLERGLPPTWRFWPARISAEEWVRKNGPWRPEAEEPPAAGEP